jgi:hypothetical protein
MSEFHLIKIKNLSKAFEISIGLNLLSYVHDFEYVIDIHLDGLHNFKFDLQTPPRAQE